ELVSAEPREGVPPADLRLQQRADLPQQLVAGAVAARVVDDLELVEIDVQDRVRRLPRFRALQRPLETALELAPIHELREDVVARRIRQPPVQLARLADVVKHEHAARDVAERIADRRGGALDVELVAVTANQECRPHRLRGAVAAHRDGDRVLDGLARLLVEAAEDLVDLPAHGIVELPAGQLLGDGVQVLHTALGVRRHDAIAYRLQRDLRALLLAEQRLFVELALRDVRLDADQPPQPAVLVDPALHAALHPAPLAVRMPHPMHALEELGLALEMLTDLRLHACHVVRMDEKAPLRDRLVLRVTEHRPPARREVHRVVADVVVPEAVVRRVRDEAIALLDRHEVLLETDPLEAARAAHADQLQREVQIGVPVRARGRRADAEHPAEALAEVEADHEDRADVEARELLRVAALRERRVRGVLDLEQPQMLEPAADPREVAQLAALQHLGVTGRERRPPGIDCLDYARILVEQGDEHRVGPVRVGELLQARLEALLGVRQSDGLEVDGDLRADEVEPVPAWQLRRPADKGGGRRHFLGWILFNNVNAPSASLRTRTAPGTSPICVEPRMRPHSDSNCKDYKQPLAEPRGPSSVRRSPRPARIPSRPCGLRPAQPGRPAGLPRFRVM